MAVETRTPSRTLRGPGPTPLAPGALWSASAGNPSARQAFEERPLGRQQFVVPPAPDRDRPANPVVRRRHFGVVLQAAEDGQDALPGPLRVAERGPLVVVGR